jgi:tRNA pseudouridine13 synthase
MQRIVFYNRSERPGLSPPYLHRPDKPGGSLPGASPMDMHTVIHPPLVTASLAGVGGRIKVEPEDFEVEEIPAYVPSGEGDFLYLWIEKRGMGAEYFLRQVARRLDIAIGEVGSAGLKDRRAVTRQMVSVPVAAEGRLAALEGDGIRVLNVSRHTNKLRPGHLHGNRFRVLVREAHNDPAALDAIVEALRRQGVPNFYGPQRFGKDGESLELGLALLRGEKPGRPVRSPFLRKLVLSAAQSGLFNHYLACRLADGLLRTVLLGDVMAKLPFGGMFVAQDIAREQERFETRETVTAGPIFGRKTFAAADDAARRENETLAVFGLSAASFRGFGKLVQGTRRHNVIYVTDLSAAWEPAGLRLTFTLPAGSYATVLLREIMKQQIEDEETA